jgi:hypothetical protein
MAPNHSGSLSNIAIIGDYYATLTSGHVLGGIEGEAADAKGAHLLPLILGTMRLAGIFNQNQIMLSTYPDNFFHIAGLTI